MGNPAGYGYYQNEESWSVQEKLWRKQMKTIKIWSRGNSRDRKGKNHIRSAAKGSKRVIATWDCRILQKSNSLTFIFISNFALEDENVRFVFLSSVAALP